MSATYDPSSSLTLQDGEEFDAEPGLVMENVSIIGLNNRITGQPLFGTDISLDSSSPSSLRLAIQNSLGANVNLNGKGTLVLDDNLRLAADSQIVGPGVVNINNRQLVFGGSYSSAWDQDISWQNAADMALSGRTDLSAVWTFSNDAVLNGNGNVLDMSSGGQIVLNPGVRLDLVDIHIRGLGDTGGKGKFVFHDDDAQIRLYNADLEVVNDITTTLGGFYAEGATTFILKDNDWTFEQNASLTVDGITLWKDPLAIENDWGDIKFGSGEIGNYLSYLNTGTIKYVSSVPQELVDLIEQNSWAIIANDEDIYENSWAIVNNDEDIYWNSWAIVNNDEDIYWNSWGVLYAVSLDNYDIYRNHKIYPTGVTTMDPQKAIWFAKGLTLHPNAILNYNNPVFVYGPIVMHNTGNLNMNGSLHIDSNITFTMGGIIDGNTHTIFLGGDTVVGSGQILHFASDTIINGQGNNLILEPNAQLLVDNNVTLTLRNVVLKNLQDNTQKGIALADNSTLALQNATIILSGNYTMTQGSLFIHEDVSITENSEFIYSTSKLSHITDLSTLYLRNGCKFVYAPPTASNDLIVMDTVDSQFYLDRADLITTGTAWQLTKGVLIFDNKVNVQVSGTTISEAIEFGNGSAAQDLQIVVTPAAVVEITGPVNYNNVN